jgi:hypothetical protein
MKKLRMDMTRNTNGITTQPKRADVAGLSTVFAGALLVSTIIGCKTDTVSAPDTLQASSRDFKARIEEAPKDKCFSNVGSLPDHVIGGSGAAYDPFVVLPKMGRESEGLGSSPVQVPLTVDIEGNRIHFKILLTLSQLKEANGRFLSTELKTIIRKSSTRSLEVKCVKLRGKVSVEMMGFVREARARVGAQSDEILVYLGQPLSDRHFSRSLKKEPSASMKLPSWVLKDLGQPLSDRHFSRSLKKEPSASIKLPSQVLKGDGTEKSPFVIRLQHISEKKGNILLTPGIMDLKEIGRIHFLVIFNSPQLYQQVRGNISLELRRVMRACGERYAKERDIRIDGKIDVNAGAFVQYALEQMQREEDGFKSSGLKGAGPVER